MPTIRNVTSGPCGSTFCSALSTSAGLNDANRSVSPTLRFAAAARLSPMFSSSTASRSAGRPSTTRAPVDHPPEPVVDLGGGREELAVGPNERELAERGDVGDARVRDGTPRSCSGVAVPGVDLELGRAAGVPRSAPASSRCDGRPRTARAPPRRRTRQQRQHDDAAPPPPDLRSPDEPDRPHASPRSSRRARPRTRSKRPMRPLLRPRSRCGRRASARCGRRRPRRRRRG